MDKLEELRRIAETALTTIQPESIWRDVLALLDVIRVQRDALQHIREEPNRMGLMADELVDEYNLTAWYDAGAALARVAKILGGGE